MITTTKLIAAVLVQNAAAFSIAAGPADSALVQVQNGNKNKLKKPLVPSRNLIDAEPNDRRINVNDDHAPVRILIVFNSVFSVQP